MKLFDRDGNEIQVTNYRGEVLNEAVNGVTIVKARNGKYLLTPFLFWAAWGGVITSYTASACTFFAGIVFWNWAPIFLGILFLVGAFAGNYFLVEYYKHHGVPKKFKEEKKELYCKKCQQQIEDELEIGKEHRAQELLTELQSLGINLNVLEAPKPVEEPEPAGWVPPEESPFRNY